MNEKIVEMKPELL